MAHHLDAERARALVDQFASRHVLVVGDVMIDEFVVGRVDRISPEAPVPVVRYQRSDARLGGAANVAQNLAAYGARVALVGLTGADAAADTLAGLVGHAGIDGSGLVADASRPTTRKQRIVTTRNQQVARVDYEEDADATGDVATRLADHVSRLAASADVVVVSDYLKGAITATVMRAAVAAADARGIAVLVDPKIPHIDRYHGATLITPNHHEAETATAMRIRTSDDARDAARRFRAIAGCQSVMITRGEHGLWLLEGRDHGRDASSLGVEMGIDATAQEVSDVTGAGDTVIATCALAVACRATLAEAAMLANDAAGVSVSKFGPATVTRDELLARLSGRRP